MGRFVDLNSPLSEEDKQYLRSRGRGYLIPANERRFGVNGDKDEDGGGTNHAISPFYQPEDRAAAVYDVGGAPLPGTVLDYDTGRVADRENGVLAEYTGPGHTPGAHDLTPQRDPEYGGFESYDVDENGDPVDDHIDEDIVKWVLDLDTKADIVKELKDRNIEYDNRANKQDLQTTLAIGLQDARDEGKEIGIEDSDSDSGEQEPQED